jgi:hypothetical protein
MVEIHHNFPGKPWWRSTIIPRKIMVEIVVASPTAATPSCSPTQLSQTMSAYLYSLSDYGRSDDYHPGFHIEVTLLYRVCVMVHHIIDWGRRGRSGWTSTIGCHHGLHHEFPDKAPCLLSRRIYRGPRGGDAL